MQVKELLKLLTNPDRIRVFKGKELIYCGYLGIYKGEKDTGVDEEAEIVRFQAHLDIKHKDWEQLGLLPPIQRGDAPDYRFSDL